MSITAICLGLQPSPYRYIQKHRPQEDSDKSLMDRNERRARETLELYRKLLTGNEMSVAELAVATNRSGDNVRTMLSIYRNAGLAAATRTAISESGGKIKYWTWIEELPCR